MRLVDTSFKDKFGLIFFLINLSQFNPSTFYLFEIDLQAFNLTIQHDCGVYRLTWAN
jgi:hypothetical protein